VLLAALHFRFRLHLSLANQRPASRLHVSVGIERGRGGQPGGQVAILLAILGHSARLLGSSLGAGQARLARRKRLVQVRGAPVVAIEEASEREQRCGGQNKADLRLYFGFNDVLKMSEMCLKMGS